MQSILVSSSLSFLAGALAALAHPSEFGPGYFILLSALPVFLWQLEKAPTIAKTALVIACYNLGFDATGYYWIPHTLREFGQLPYALSIILGIFFSLILQPHWWGYLIWKKLRPAWDWHSQRNIILTALVMTLLERYWPQQFPSYVGSPWLHLAPYLGLMPIFGTILFSFMTIWISLEAVEAVRRKKLRPQAWILFLLFVLINVLIPVRQPEKVADLKVRFVQANIGNFMKISSEYGDVNSFEAVRKKYLDLSVTDNGFKPDLIIWPETAYPDAFYGEETPLNDLFSEIEKKTGAELVVGGYDQNKTANPMAVIESVYNAAILIRDGKVQATYHKNILIPFGETLPFGPFNRSFVELVPAVSLFAKGRGTTLMATRQDYRFIAPICYEILDSEFIRGLLNQWRNNRLIINLTNDSWYGDTAEPYQHLFLAKMRALEFALPILRSTNTGITSVTYADGSESKRLNIGETGILDLVVPISAPQNTIYQLYGSIPFYFFALILLAFNLIRDPIPLRFRRRDNQ